MGKMKQRLLQVALFMIARHFCGVRNNNFKHSLLVMSHHLACINNMPISPQNQTKHLYSDNPWIPCQD
jgi:hypothetical protein